MTQRPVIETVLSPCEKTLAYLAKGNWSAKAIIQAVKNHDGTELPSDAAVAYIKAGLECWHGCGFYHDRATRGDGHLKHCEGDDESWAWNFRSGVDYTILPKPGVALADLDVGMSDPRIIEIVGAALGRTSVYETPKHQNEHALELMGILRLRGYEVVAQKNPWNPIETAKKNGSPVLAKIHDDLFPRVRPDRADLKTWNGRVIEVAHPGILSDGLDVGWGMVAPVGHGGFPDDWFAGWIAVPLSTEA